MSAPPGSFEDEGSLVLLVRCADHVEAQLVQALLRAHDITAVAQGEQHRAMLGLMGSYIEVNVLVARRDLARARELLESQLPGDEGPLREEEAAALLPEPGPDAAPEPADDSRARRRRQLGVWVLLLLFGAPLAVALASWLLGQRP